MNLIECLKQANRKPFRRKSWISNVTLQECCGGLISIENGIQESGGFLVQCTGNLTANDWYVVEPKSKIEEAIEREVGNAIEVGKAGISQLSTGVTLLDMSYRRVANIALDEAKRAVASGFVGLITTDRNALERIDALKVKE